jgi:hypothetical protein
MSLRDKLFERVSPWLPDEQVQQVFLAQGGGNPWLVNGLSGLGGLLGGLLGNAFVKRYIVAVTDKSVVVFTTNYNGTKPEATAMVLPRQTRLGPHKGIWGRINLDGQKYYAHAKFRKDIQAADAALEGAAA